ncbi:hypothetical protein H0H92_009569 [Tricholoma furcatifolium]|nr:hypothetical protein H0H92_009569 [Tricholoma furcatifolium]
MRKGAMNLTACRDIVNTVSAKYHDDVANNDNHNSTGSKDSVDATKSILTIQNVPCAQSVIWLENVLQNEQQEDIVTLFFDFWLLSLSVVTILNESLPHLGASLAGHTLGTAWAAFRIASYQRLQRNYENIIVHGTCQMDFLASWWSLRNAVLILIFNGLGFLVMGFLSFKLFKVYATQSFSRVGASPQVNNIYKLVLVFSACLQLAAFFLVASASMWIDNLRYTSIEGMTDRTNYLIAVTITFVLWLPWLYLGWTSVRREVKRCFTVFTFVSAFFIVISALMFSSDLYRFIFNTWALFATVTITAFITLVATVVLGVWCRLNFGKGLSHFLQVTDALEGVDFTPVMFPNDKEKGFLGAPFDADPSSPDEKYPLDTMAEPIAQPQAAYKPAIKLRQSVYSEKNGVSMKLSYTPSLFQDRAAERAASCSRTPTAWSTRSRALTPSMRSSVVSSASAPVSTRSITPTPTIVVSKV